MDNTATTPTAPGNPPQSWGEEPNFRGTFGIIFLCFSTLIICTWNVVHFNVPARRYSDSYRLLFQVLWMVIALGAPEVLLFLALNEYIRAGELLKGALKRPKHPTESTWFARMCHDIGEAIRGLAEWIVVSAQCLYVI